MQTRINDIDSNTPVEGYAGCCAAIATINLLTQHQQQRSPALVIVGDQDQATPLAAAQALVQHWPGARLVVLADASHLANVEQAEAFNDAVLGFLMAPDSAIDSTRSA